MLTNTSDVIFEQVARLAIPFIQIYGLYVIAHGHYSPGGGFQGGVAIGASFILMTLAFSWREAYSRLPEGAIVVLGAVGVMMYIGTGFACALCGGHFLEYAALAPILGVDAEKARYIGMAIVEWGVGIAVMAIMVSLFLDLVTGGKHEEAFAGDDPGKELVDP